MNWSTVGSYRSYIVGATVGNTYKESVVTGTSWASPAAPGQNGYYAVRANTPSSTFSRVVTIAYPATPASVPAPSLSVSGQTLNWSTVGSYRSYIVGATVGNTYKESVVTGTSWASPAAPGQNGYYAVRANTPSSTFSRVVTIAYPATPTAPVPSSTSFRMGIVAGGSLTYEVPYLSTLGAHSARLTVDIDASAASLASTIDAYARAGVQPLLMASFPGRVPSTGEAQNVATWAAAYGPGGTFWARKSYPANTAVADIEFGSETSYSYQFADTASDPGWWGSTALKTRAQNYALRVKDAQVAIHAANPRVGLLAIADDGGGGSAWVDSMFAAVPDLGSRVAGWTVHPYGVNGLHRIDQLVADTSAMGAPATVPIYVTEWGLATDDGHCLSDNYGYDRCMSYASAASTLHSELATLRSRYPNRIGGFFLYEAHDSSAPGSTTSREGYFGALRQDGSAKGAFTSEVRADLAASP